ncbi:MAG TPA: aspartate-semialdehyde dehydrogenase [Candidatus Binatia bacterium]|jgi:aspartate-semialdehyde dehydrogenase|nr:aspartate-semialdehyde dehydrogenase [Candidatus Binatia bacterium]
MAEALTVAVIGPTGLVGREIVELLSERQFPLGELRLLGSVKTAGGELEHDDRRQKVALLGPGSFDGVDVAFFAAGPAVAGEFAPAAADAGAAVIDVSSRFRLADGVPLVVPEVNALAIADRRESGIVASPSATTVGLAVVLAPLAEAAGLRRVVVSTYQAASGGGRRAMQGLSEETLDLLSARGPGRPRFAHRRAFNCVPQVGAIEPGGATTHELHVVEETRKVLGNPALALSVTAVRVPTFYGHAMAVTLETEEALGAAAAADLLREARGVVLHAGEEDAYPTPVEIAGADAIHVGRIRDDTAAEQSIALWVSLDNVRKGGALNAVEIAEILVRDYL